jgi:hypothetical protein
VLRVLPMKIKICVIPMPVSSQATDTPTSATTSPIIRPRATATR